jgi:ketosteroid isomerase-like protein
VLGACRHADSPPPLIAHAKRMKTIAAIASTLLLLGCAHAPVGTSDARAIAEAKAVVFSSALLEASESSWEGAKVENLVALYTDDATLFQPNGPPIKGKEAIRRYWSRTSDRRILKHQVVVEHAEYSGALLYEYGRFSGTFETNGVASVTTARYISVWRKEIDGAWRKHMDTWW